MSERCLDETVYIAPEGWRKGKIAWDGNGSIVAIEGEETSPPAPDQSRLVAGFVDLHVHGGGGGDAMNGPEDVRTMAAAHARFGTAALAPTTMSAPAEKMKAALTGIEQVRAMMPAQDEAMVLGAHLEGPFLNPIRRGAQPDHLLAADVDMLAAFLDCGRIIVATVAPEIAGGMDLLPRLKDVGVKAQIGHSDADSKQARAALDSGFSGFTHLYNAMRPSHHRDTGVIDCALARATHAELICDLVHVGADALLTAIRAIPNAYAVTDATAAAAQADGDYELGGQRISKKGGTCYLANRELAGTALTMWDCRRNLLGLGLDELLVQKMVSERPAAYVGRDDLGLIELGRQASFVEIAGDEIQRVCLRGSWLDSPIQA